jgi:hypothetical protein
VNMSEESDTEVQDASCHVSFSAHLLRRNYETHLFIKKLKINPRAATQISCVMTSFPADKKGRHMFFVRSFFFVRSENTYMCVSLLFTNFHGVRL